MPLRPAIVTYSVGDDVRVGVVSGDGVVEASARSPDRWPDLRAAVHGGRAREIVDAHAGMAPDLPLAGLRLAPPIPTGAKILCVGVNYPDRAAEYGAEVTAPAYPSLFVRFPESFVGHEAPLVRPRVSKQLDYEGEIVIVIGKGGRHIAEADALGHISALSLCNEGSVRDWMRHGKFNVTQGKNFAASGALGPWLTPYEEEGQIADIRLTTRVNGELRQDDRTSRMLFGFRRIITYISTFASLAPGDVIVTGTPSGAGARRDPPVWLAPGDVVEIEADGIGLLRNGVVDEAVA